MLKKFLFTAAVLLSACPVFAGPSCQMPENPAITPVLRYLQENPCVLMDILREHRAELLSMLADATKEQNESQTIKQMEQEAKTLPKAALTGRPSEGAKNPAVRLLAFINFDCGWCARNVKNLDEFVKRHPEASITYKCTWWDGAPGKTTAAWFLALWRQKPSFGLDFYRLAMKNAGEIRQRGEALLRELAASIGADADKAAKDAAGKEIAAMLDEDFKDFGNLTEGGTPYTFVGGVHIRGALPESELDKAWNIAVRHAAGRGCDGE